MTPQLTASCIWTGPYVNLMLNLCQSMLTGQQIVQTFFITLVFNVVCDTPPFVSVNFFILFLTHTRKWHYNVHWHHAFHWHHALNLCTPPFLYLSYLCFPNLPLTQLLWPDLQVSILLHIFASKLKLSCHFSRFVCYLIFLIPLKCPDTPRK